MSAEPQTAFDPRIVLRPRSVDETFDLAVAYLRTEIRGLAPLFLLVSVGTTAVLAGLQWVFDLSGGIWWAAALLLVPLQERVITVYVGRHLFRGRTSVAESIATALKRSFSLGLHAVLLNAPLLMMAAGLELDSEPMVGVGVLAGLFWPFLFAARLHLTEVILLEQIPLGRAMRRAGALTTHRYGRSIGVVLLGAALRIIFIFAVLSGANFLVGFVLQFEGSNPYVSPIGALLGYTASGPYLALARLFDYVDARTRREGWDIQVRFNAIAERIEREDRNRAA